MLLNEYRWNTRFRFFLVLKEDRGDRKSSFCLSDSAKVSRVQPVNDSLFYWRSHERSSCFPRLLRSEQGRENGIFHSSLIPGPNRLLISISLSIKGGLLHARIGGRPLRPPVFQGWLMQREQRLKLPGETAIVRGRHRTSSQVTDAIGRAGGHRSFPPRLAPHYRHPARWDGGRGRPVHSSRALSQSIPTERNDNRRKGNPSAPSTGHRPSAFSEAFRPVLVWARLVFFYRSFGLNPHICNVISSKMADPLPHFHTVMLGFVF